ncbi:MAG: hypothetical protein FWC79_08425 [Oscillospiraceae bacterium]|nr:hypothetical protein [Oscillospiraceae bacterium]
MINEIIKNIQEIEKPILEFILKGLNFSAGVCFVALIFLIIFATYPISHMILDSSLILFQTGAVFAAGFIVFGFVIDKLKKHIV